MPISLVMDRDIRDSPTVCRHGADGKVPDELVKPTAGPSNHHPSIPRRPTFSTVGHKTPWSLSATCSAPPARSSLGSRLMLSRQMRRTPRPLTLARWPPPPPALTTGPSGRKAAATSAARAAPAARTRPPGPAAAASCVARAGALAAQGSSPATLVTSDAHLCRRHR